MADFKRLNRYRDELNKMKEKRAELDDKIRSMERKCKEEENVAIHDIVHEANMTPEQLASLIKMNGAEKIKAINGTIESKESEVNIKNEEDY